MYMSLGHSVDLFTGIGGFAVAFEGLLTPIAYCERDAAATRTLEGLMGRGMLPSAPVVPDVADVAGIKAAVGGRRVRLVTAGFPCVGFSSSGNRRGLENAQSGLFHAAAEVVRGLEPDMVFFENVPGILAVNGGGDLATVLATMTGLGYDMRWTVVAARDSGVPQLRRRWFCLCTRRGAALDAAEWAGRVRGGAPRAMPPLVSSGRAPGFRDRYKMLGNSIVPAAARAAFERLVSAPAFSGVGVAGGDNTHGVCVGGVVGHVRVVADDYADAGMYAPIAVASTHYSTSKRASQVVDANRIDGAKRALFPTPRAQMCRNSNHLTRRTVCDLPTFALFAESVGGVAQPGTRDGDCVSIAFVEWLMGYPEGWTAAATPCP